MANVVLPIMYYFLALGKTIDLRNYESMTDYRLKSIFDTADIVETPVNSLNSTYYVLPDEKIPYSKLGVPIDLILLDKPGRVYRNMMDYAYRFLSNTLFSATIIIKTEYIKTDKSIKENATPIPGWQENGNVPKSHTHYFDKMHYGGRCISLINVLSSVPGDIQILRRIFTEVMGKSGSVDRDTADLWRKAVKAINESGEIRGKVSFPFSVMSYPFSFADLPSEAHTSVENLLKYLPEFPKYVSLGDLNGRVKGHPLYVTLKPLHDLDEGYATVEKNVLAERYFVDLQAMYSDLQTTNDELQYLYNRISSDEDYKKLNVFYRKLRSVRRSVGPLTFGDLSMYENINIAEFEAAFKKYREGLDNSTENYYTSYQRLFEELGARCEDNFLKPVRGSLLVEKNEVIQKDSIDLARCQDICIKDKRCRSIGYDENEQCLIYYRSTNSAKIIFSESGSPTAKVYDRKCT